MARPVRYHRRFAQDLAGQLRWLRAKRPPGEIAALRAALRSFRRRIAAHPALGEETERHGSISWRVFPLSTRLPYLVWYFYDDADLRAPVSLVPLVHEAQDRAGFEPPD